jgi:hypothetical protein
MKKLLLFTIAFILCGISFAQVFQPVTPTAYGSNNNRVKADSTLFIPTFVSTPVGSAGLKSNNPQRKGAIAIDTTNGRFAWYNPSGETWNYIENAYNYKQKSDSLFNDGYTRRDRTKQGLDSISIVTLSRIHDSLYANYAIKAASSAGGRFISNSGSIVAEWGVGGGTNFDFHGFAGYDANRSSSYTTRSFTDKGYVDSSRALDVQLTGTQTITGAKTFSSNLTATARVNVGGVTDNSSYVLNTLGSTAIRASAAKAYQLSLLQATDSTSGWAFDADNSGNLTLIRRSSGVYQSPTFSWSSAGTITTNGNSITIGSTIGTGIGTLFSRNNFFTAYNYGTTGSPLYEEILGYSYDGTARFALQASNSYTNNQGTGFRFKITDGSGTAIYPLSFSNAIGDANFSSLGTGTVYSNSGTLTNTNPSDSSLKNTIKPLGYGLSEVLKLQPKTFYYNSDKAKTSLKYGFIAQEVQKIMPDVVREFNTYKTVDSAGNKVEQVVKKLGLESDGIYVTLVKAIQEQQVIIDDLKKRILALENK